MAVVGVCGVLVLVGLGALVRWGGLTFEPVGRYGPSLGQRYLWNLTIGITAGLGSGLLMAGPGGRLAMRLLAVTAGDAAQGRLTEADEIVGRITVGGSFGFVIFVGLFFGGVSGIVFILIRRWLPAGRLGGLVYGALLLVIAGTRLDPLRADNPDFDLVGPAWVALAVFVALTLAHGMVVAAVAGRVSQTLRPFSVRSRGALGYLPLLLLLPVFPVLIFIGAVGAIVVAFDRVGRAGRRPAPGKPGPERPLSTGALRAGRAALAGLALAAAPGFVSALVDIAR